MNRYILGAPALVGQELTSMACTPKVRDGDVWHMLMPVPDPPKRYSFAEAYKMMKDGKWMRPVGSNVRRRMNCSNRWQTGSGAFPTFTENFNNTEIDSQWEEAP